MVPLQPPLVVHEVVSPEEQVGPASATLQEIRQRTHNNIRTDKDITVSDGEECLKEMKREDQPRGGATAPFHSAGGTQMRVRAPGCGREHFHCAGHSASPAHVWLQK
ncbi:hypothetical protein D7W81_06045 [Corallococcus aberystwythensis]|uniref:Uncharacterized protein n=1 Tax=Corallococcus aberystwythensis TaxID=2316722 RepID=A0A3A8QZL0_9BACT|nr:hypothetical protein D7W81_06045 [Corallococcus aberystwythensis]